MKAGYSKMNLLPFRIHWACEFSAPRGASKPAKISASFLVVLKHDGRVGFDFEKPDFEKPATLKVG